VTVFVAFLRAINVGGTGKLLMSELRALCEDAGFKDVQTYIQSGNVLFESRLSEAKVKATLERALTGKLGKASAALVRSAAELEQILQANPFPGAPPNQVLVMLLDAPPPALDLAALNIPGTEKLCLKGRELFIHFPDGMGRSKLKIPFAKTGTGRNINTLTKLGVLAQARTK
jgi:uncharacterized protein (DUF1697 family)